MMEINQKERNVARQFWAHISSQGRKTEGDPHLLTTQEGMRGGGGTSTRIY